MSAILALDITWLRLFVGLNTRILYRFELASAAAIASDANKVTHRTKADVISRRVNSATVAIAFKGKREK